MQLITGIALPVFMAFINSLNAKIKGLTEKIESLEREMHQTHISIARDLVEKRDYNASQKEREKEVASVTRSVAVAHVRLDRVEDNIGIGRSKRMRGNDDD